MIKAFLTGMALGAFALPTIVQADNSAPTQATAPDTKAGGIGYSDYNRTSSNESVSTDTGTVPSGKRHRTHKKRHKTETTDDSRTIQTNDVTPAK